MNNTKKKDIIPITFFILILIIGFLIMLYPFISMKIYKYNQDKVINDYKNKVEKISSEEKNKSIEDAINYNNTITGKYLVDAFSNTSGNTMSEDYQKLLNFGNDGEMGYISIPKIDVNIPIYHGTSAEVLKKGVGHVEGTALPVGGVSTHSVLSAHRGLPNARLFTDLDELKEGDMFSIHIMDQTFTYQVDQIMVIEPSNIDDLQIVKGEDYLTLVTCTPYGVNSHRLLVRGKRCENVSEIVVVDSKKVYTIDLLFYIVLGLSIILFLVITIILKKYNKNEDE